MQAKGSLIKGSFFFVSVLLFIAYPNPASTQNKPIADSLKLVLSSEDLSEDERFEVLRLIAIKETSISSAEKYGRQLIAEAQEKGNKKYLAHGYLALGSVYTLSGQLEKALESLTVGATIANEIKDLSLLGNFFGQIANAYTVNNDINNSFIYQKKAIELFKQQGDTLSIGLASLNIAYDYYNQSQYDSASKFNQLALEIFVKKDFATGVAYVIGNQALISWKEGNDLLAEQELIRAIDILEPLGDYYAIADYKTKLAMLYFETEQYEQALESANKGLILSEKEGLQESVRDASLILSKIYERNGDLSEALWAYKKHTIIKDSIQNIEITQRMADLRTEYEVGQKQSEIDLLDAQKQAREQLLIAGGIIFIILLIGTFLIYRSYRVQSILSRKLADQKHQLEKINSSKDKLFSILSHDLRGPIAAFSGVSNMIKIAVRTQKVEMLDEIADEVKLSSTKLSDMLENLLTWAVQEQKGFELKPEPIAVQDLFADMKGMYQSLAAGKSIKLSTPEELDIKILADKNTTLTIFRNLVNNALKFTPQGGQVTLDCQAISQMAILTVSDTGVGISEEKLENLFVFQGQKSSFGTAGEKGLGLGLNLVSEFVKINQGDISVASIPGNGTTFTVRLPLA